MTSRPRTLALIVGIVLAVSGCSATVGADNSPTGTGGTIELAVAEACAAADTALDQLIARK